jgi:hypothetical protein
VGLIGVLAMATTVFAADYPKDTYSVSGMLLCITAPSGFSNDPKGNPSVANGNDSFLNGNTFQGLFAFNGDGTGKITALYTAISPPPPDSRAAPKPSISGGTFTYDVTTTPIVDHRFSATAKPAKGTVDSGLGAGQQYSADVWTRSFLVSNDQKTMAMTIATPYLETLTFSGSPNVHTTRSCIATGNLTRME